MTHTCLSHADATNLTTSVMLPEVRMFAELFVCSFIGVLDSIFSEDFGEAVVCQHIEAVSIETAHYTPPAVAALMELAQAVTEFADVEALANVFRALVDEHGMSAR